MKRNTSTPKMHHFVPRSYLARFCDNDGFLHVFDRYSQMFRRQRPKEVMRINYYYRQEWAPPGVDPNLLEKALGEWIETAAKDSIDRLIHLPSTLTDIDTATFLTYLELQRIRVPRQAETAKALMREALLRLAPPKATADICAGKVLLTIKDSARFEYMRMLIGRLHPWFGQMEWEVFEAAQGAAFATTDSPVSFYNPKILPPAEAGIALAGTMAFFPLSSRHVLLMRNSTPSGNVDISPLTVLSEPSVEDGQLSITHGVVWSKDVVDNFNWKIAQLCDRFVVAESKETLYGCTSN